MEIQIVAEYGNQQDSVTFFKINNYGNNFRQKFNK